ncbi:MAG: BlaI/MecI/CopY family transcriptional regulator [Bacteroidales bacterium]
MENKMIELTRAEEEVMQILWELGKCFVKDIVEKMPEPKPAYNTVSTVVRILQKKGFVGYTAFGKTHEYFPLVAKENYTREYVNGFVQSYFNSSYKGLVSFFATENRLSLNELEEIRALVESEIEKSKT